MCILFVAYIESHTGMQRTYSPIIKARLTITHIVICTISDGIKVTDGRSENRIIVLQLLFCLLYILFQIGDIVGKSIIYRLF